MTTSISPMKTVLIDGDIAAYRAAASCEKQGVVTDDSWVAKARADNTIQQILAACSSDVCKVYLTGSDNFRSTLNPEYKANRRDLRRPEWLQIVREHLVVYHGASVSDGEEADDLLGIAQCAGDGNTIIASIDKDLLMIPGLHYNWVKDEHREVSYIEGMRHFYWQLIMGDKADNVFGFDGLARAAVPKKLEWAINALNECITIAEMEEHVREMYNDDERFLMNGRCLWIRRQEGEIWQTTTQGPGQKHVTTAS